MAKRLTGFGNGSTARTSAVEMQPTAAALLRENALLNRADNLEVVEANAFDWLRDRAEEEPAFDLAVLDPPAFAKNKDALPAAKRGYKEVNLRARDRLPDRGDREGDRAPRHRHDPAARRELRDR